MTAPAVRRPAEALRDLPTDPFIEKYLLSCILRRPDLLRDDSFPFTVDLFHLEAHKKIARAMVELDADGIQPDPVTISDRMKEPAAHSYLEDLYDVTASPANAWHYANKLKQWAVRRRAIFDADKLTRAANSGVPEDIARVRAEIAKSPLEKTEKLGWTKYRVDIARASTVKPPAQEFVVGHLPDEPGNYGLIIGPDGVRKSWLALHIALAVAGGQPVAGAPDGSCLWSAPARGRVVYITSEDSPEVIWRRVWNIRQMPGYSWVQDLSESLDIMPVFSNLTLLTTTQDGSIIHTKEYTELVEYAKGSRLIILDPLADLFDLDENGNREGRAIVQALRQLSLLTGAGVLGVHHQNKAAMLAGEKNHQSGRGSSKFGAGCRWAVVLQPISQVLGADGAEKIGIPERELTDWTNIHESKASYAIEAAGDHWFKKMAIVEDSGHITLASAPLAASLPEKNKPVVVDRTGRLKYPEEGSENETYY